MEYGTQILSLKREQLPLLYLKTILKEMAVSTPCIVLKTGNGTCKIASVQGSRNSTAYSVIALTVPAPKGPFKNGTYPVTVLIISYQLMKKRMIIAYPVFRSRTQYILRFP